LLGLFSFGPTGLIIGHIVTQIAGIGTFSRAIWKIERENMKKISIAGINSVAREFKSFPLFTFPQQIIMILSLQIPALMLLATYDTYTVGLYTLAYNLLIFPLFFISSSLSQVFLGEMSQLVRDDFFGLKNVYLKTLKHLCLIAIPVIGGVALIAPFIVPLVFGESWIDAGLYCLPLALMAIPQFIVSTTTVLPLYGYNHWALIWDVIRVCLIIIGFYICRIFEISVMATLTVYGVIMLIMYIVMAFLNLKAIAYYTSGLGKEMEY
jgi:O-antigen/teichoic acid export membrane protein